MSTSKSVRKGSPHLMIKEIHEQPSIIDNIVNRDSEIYRNVAETILSSKKVFILGSGSSYHAGLYLDLAFKKLSLRVYSFVSSEYENFIDIADQDTVAIAISQSGTTTDTLEAVNTIKKRGSKIVGVTNVENSPLAQISDHVVYVGAGLEEAVTATKSFSGQVVNLMRIYVEVLRSLSRDFSGMYLYMKDLPKIVRDHIYRSEVFVREIVDLIYKRDNAFIAGRGYHYIASLESSLKIKETCGIHAEAFSLGEIRHGPKSTINNQYFLGISLRDKRDLDLSKKVIEETQDSDALIILSAPEDLVEIPTSDKIFVARRVSIPEEFSMILEVILYQLISYYIALARLLDPDRPRRLSKVVI
ncbi:MAG: SIS domain-containing protein [Sulfolobales archaeon]